GKPLRHPKAKSSAKSKIKCKSKCKIPSSTLPWNPTLAQKKRARMGAPIGPKKPPKFFSSLFSRVAIRETGFSRELVTERCCLCANKKARLPGPENRERK
ncbi:MAG: hypothetical protein WBV60_20340, partial [Terriglobales bacterium]